MLRAASGATRRNRPNLQPGDLVYARVLTASRDLEPTLSCVDASGKVCGFQACSASLRLTAVRTPLFLRPCGADYGLRLAVSLQMSDIH